MIPHRADTAAFDRLPGAWYLGISGRATSRCCCSWLTVVTGLYWLAERFYFKPPRTPAPQALEEQDVQRRAELARMGIAQVDGDVTRPASACSCSRGGWTGRPGCSR
jgi:signal peptidase I